MDANDVMRDDARRIWAEIESHPYLPGEVEDQLPPDRAEELAMIDPDMAELTTPTPARSRTAVELPMSDLTPFILKTLDALEAAVPLWQAGATASLPLQQQQDLGDNFQRHVDTLYGGGKPGTAGYAFNSLAEVLANLSHAPGGVNFMGLHWCTDHAVCEDPPEAEPAVPAQPRPIVDVPLPDVIPARPTDTRTTTQED